MNKNLLMMTDSYKFGGHMLMYPQGTNKIYSYMIARSDKKLPETVFFGLQYYLKEYLSTPVSHADVDEAIFYRKMILGDCPEQIEKAWRALADLGQLPIEIKAVEEGTVMPVKNVLMTVTNTHPDFFWLPNMLESFLLKIWNMTTTASFSRKYKQLAVQYATATCDDESHIPFSVHDFGYRGAASEETAATGGAAHLLNFLGTDTVPAVKLLYENYGPVEGPIGLSVSATEHSVQTTNIAYILSVIAKEGNYKGYKLDDFSGWADKTVAEALFIQDLLEIYPTGILSIVSDSYNYWDVLTKIAPWLKDKIEAREGPLSKVVFRPDSGNPEKIINGDVDVPALHPARKGSLNLLGETFGFTKNSKGYKVLNPKVGLIYGDGMYYERYQRTLEQMRSLGWASSNLVVGVGGILLQSHSRDDQGFAFKATYCEVNGEALEIVKDPITDPGKKSHKGLLLLDKHTDGTYFTLDQVSSANEKLGLLKPVYKDGVILKFYTLEEIRERINGN
jgi:nicotinamide phosphoribosyltransferase